MFAEYWANFWVVTKQATFYGEPFQATCSVTQGDIVFPMLVNIVVDAVIY